MERCAALALVSVRGWSAHLHARVWATVVFVVRVTVRVVIHEAPSEFLEGLCDAVFGPLQQNGDVFVVVDHAARVDARDDLEVNPQLCEVFIFGACHKGGCREGAHESFVDQVIWARRIHWVFARRGRVVIVRHFDVVCGVCTSARRNPLISRVSVEQEHLCPRGGSNERSDDDDVWVVLHERARRHVVLNEDCVVEGDRDQVFWRFCEQERCGGRIED